MSLSWIHRKTRLQELLKSQEDEEDEALALDRLLHGQLVIGKTARTSEVDALRFQDRDLQALGTLEYGQFGVIDVVTCKLDNRVYIRKSIEKKFALRTREQCSPQLERDILLKARKTGTCWAPHLLCAFHTPTHLNLVMDYAEGGTLWDVLESSPLEGRISLDDVRWWTPQIVSAIHWCHSQGFVHRDIKPHNLVITPTSRILLIDFGSAAPLQPPAQDGSRLVPKQYCLVPCGTCDYISPEILKAHEQALVALEIEDSQDPVFANEEQVYGLETDWWSLGAMLYEMAYGVAPFFAEDIRRTYFKIMDHRRNLKFNANVSLSAEYKDFLQRLLTDAEFRLGRHNFAEITSHPFFDGVNWDTLPQQTKPPHLHLPQFTYATPEAKASITEEFSQPFAFSALFQSSAAISSPGISILHETASLRSSPLSGDTSTTTFIGFSWGPTKHAFPEVHMEEEISQHGQHQAKPSLYGYGGLSPSTLPNPSSLNNTPRQLRIPSAWLTPTPTLHGQKLTWPRNQASMETPSNAGYAFSTPLRPTIDLATPYHTQTLPRGLGSTIRRTGTLRRRAVSDREAMKQLVDCIGMSAKKKVLESGRKPRILNSFGDGTITGRSSLSRSGGTAILKKELRFVNDSRSDGVAAVPVPRFEYPSLRYEQSGQSSGIARFFGASASVSASATGRAGSESDSGDGLTTGTDDTTDTSMESEPPPSPSPSPRPGSAMSMTMMSMMSMSKRSGTPTLTSTFSQRLGTPSTTTTRSLGNVMSSGASSSAGGNRSAYGDSVKGIQMQVQTRRDTSPEERDGKRNGSTSNMSTSTRMSGSRVTLSFEHETLDGLEVKHAAIMDDISSLEKRLGRISQRFVGR